MILSTLVASSLALSCNFQQSQTQLKLNQISAQKYELVVQSSEPDLQNHQMQTVTNTYPLHLLGNVNERGIDKIFFAGVGAEEGKLTLRIAKDSANGTRKVEFEQDYNSSSGDCTDGPKFARLAQSAQSAGTISAETASDYRDSQLGLKCTDSQNTRYNIRTLEGSYAGTSVQVEIGPYGGTNNLNIMLDTFSEAADAVSLSIIPGHLQIPDVPQDTAIVVPKIPGANGLYAATYVSAGVRTPIACKGYWALANVWRAVAESHTLARTLPSPIGTLADVKLSVTQDYDQMKSIQNRYMNLIMDIPGVNGMAVMSYEANDPKNPLHVKCEYVDIMLGTAADEAIVKAILGDSVEGGLLQYEVTGSFQW